MNADYKVHAYVSDYRLLIWHALMHECPYGEVVIQSRAPTWHVSTCDVMFTMFGEFVRHLTWALYMPVECFTEEHVCKQLDFLMRACIFISSLFYMTDLCR